MPAAVPPYRSAAVSDQGLHRPNNEDRVYCDDSRGIFLVVDGMGGHEAGEQAAEIAVQRIRARLERGTDSVEQRLREAIALANNAIFEATQGRPEWKGMACVLTAAVIEDGQVTIGHVGDSRLYRIANGVIEKVTLDHSPVGEREDRGELTEIAAMQHPRRNEVYRDVGSEEHAPDDEGFIQIVRFPFAPDSALLICSDGLTDAVPSSQILSVIEQNAGDRWRGVRKLIAAATAVGQDNVSVVLVEGSRFAGSRRAAVIVPLYRRGLVTALGGVMLGALIMLAIGTVLSRQQAAHAPRTWDVMSGDSIGSLIQQARAGDTVRVAPGVYSETVSLKDGLTLEALVPGATAIEGGLIANNLRTSRLEGFHIGGANGIRIANSHVILIRDDISGSLGAGVEFSGNSSGAVVGCTIHGNAGPGILLSDTAWPAIEHNVLLDNGKEPGALKPGLLVQTSGTSVISGNTFAGNGAEAIWLPAPDETILQRNFFLLSGAPSARLTVRIVPLKGKRP